MVALAVVGLGVWAWEPVWWWVMTERCLLTEGDPELIIAQGDEVRGFLSRAPPASEQP